MKIIKTLVKEKIIILNAFIISFLAYIFLLWARINYSAVSQHEGNINDKINFLVFIISLLICLLFPVFIIFFKEKKVSYSLKFGIYSTIITIFISILIYQSWFYPIIELVKINLDFVLGFIWLWNLISIYMITFQNMMYFRKIKNKIRFLDIILLLISLSLIVLISWATLYLE